MNTKAIELTLLTAADIAEVAALARAIWREHHTRFISAAQVEYMLADRYSAEDLGAFVGATGRWFEVLRVGGMVCGFLRCLVESPQQGRLAEVYVAKEFRGQGLGQRLLARAEELVAQHGCGVMLLYVNRANAAAIKVYTRAGYRIVRECDIDIGGGFCMNDYLMEKPLSAHAGSAGEAAASFRR